MVQGLSGSAPLGEPVKRAPDEGKRFEAQQELDRAAAKLGGQRTGSEERIAGDQRQTQNQAKTLERIEAFKDYHKDPSCELDQTELLALLQAVDGGAGSQGRHQLQVNDKHVDVTVGAADQAAGEALKRSIHEALGPLDARTEALLDKEAARLSFAKPDGTAVFTPKEVPSPVRPEALTPAAPPAPLVPPAPPAPPAPATPLLAPNGTSPTLQQVDAEVTRAKQAYERSAKDPAAKQRLLEALLAGADGYRQQGYGDSSYNGEAVSLAADLAWDPKTATAPQREQMKLAASATMASPSDEHPGQRYQAENLLTRLGQAMPAASPPASTRPAARPQATPLPRTTPTPRPAAPQRAPLKPRSVSVQLQDADQAVRAAKAAYNRNPADGAAQASYMAALLAGAKVYDDCGYKDSSHNGDAVKLAAKIGWDPAKATPDQQAMMAIARANVAAQATSR